MTWRSARPSASLREVGCDAVKMEGAGVIADRTRAVRPRRHPRDGPCWAAAAARRAGEAFSRPGRPWNRRSTSRGPPRARSPPVASLSCSRRSLRLSRPAIVSVAADPRDRYRCRGRHRRAGARLPRPLRLGAAHPPRFAREYAHLFSAMIEARARTPPRCVRGNSPWKRTPITSTPGSWPAFSRAPRRSVMSGPDSSGPARSTRLSSKQRAALSCGSPSPVAHRPRRTSWSDPGAPCGAGRCVRARELVKIRAQCSGGGETEGCRSGARPRCWPPRSCR